ncbi:MAG: CBS domain-containing protein [Euryarchaeota archaeon]|nr:CBS domain-containing protein [Euryarchaeota archaeon]
MELTSVQKEILRALISLYRENPRSIRGEEIAQIVGRNPGTIRNQMQSLKALHLVEGVPGPKGGYRATSRAYQELELDTLSEEAHVVLVRNDVEVTNALIEEIDFTTVAHPDVCSAVVKIIGNTRDFNIGDTLKVGPTPVNKLTFKGTVCGRDDSENKVIITVSEMISLPKTRVGDYASDALICVDADMSLQQIAATLINNDIRGAPVKNNGRLVGFITLKDIGKAVASGQGGSARDFMSQSLFSIDEEAPMYEAIRLFQERKVGHLLVTRDGSPEAVITRTDVLRQLFSSLM